MSRLPGTTGAVVMAGGSAGRLGTLGAILAKPLLPISDSEVLLSRTLIHLQKSGASSILISTSPNDYDLVRVLVDRWETRSPRGVSPEVIRNPLHADGPVAAFAEAIRGVASSRVVMCLADVWSKSNPFVRLLAPDAADSIITARRVSDNVAIAQGGVAYGSKSIVLRMAEHFDHSHLPPTCDVHVWNGAAALPKQIWVTAAADALSNSTVPSEEDMLNAAIGAGCRIDIAEAPPFINVNTHSDWRRVLTLNDSGNAADDRPATEPSL